MESSKPARRLRHCYGYLKTDHIGNRYPEEPLTCNSCLFKHLDYLNCPAKPNKWDFPSTKDLHVHEHNYGLKCLVSIVHESDPQTKVQGLAVLDN